jgi:glycosyltransferase involved in cell wall biosynthesis
VREAFSKAKTMVGTRLGGTPEMITDGETGLLVPAGDAAALANAMQRLIADGDIREKLSQAAYRRANQYKAEVIVPQFEALYRQLIEAANQ